MKKILLIEDNNEVRENTAEILQLAGYEVTTAANGKLGVEACKRGLPDLIVCDIMMPELDGYGVLHILSKSEDTASIPFIFLTAKAERDDIRKGMTLGADDYLTKPFDDSELLDAIEARMKRHERFRVSFNRDAEGLNQFMVDARSHAGLQQLSETSEVRKVHKKDSIYQEGSAPRFLYFLRSGKVKTGMINADGKEYITGVYKEGDFFGYLALMEGGAYTDNAVALEESELVLIPSADFHVLMDKNREVASRFIKMLSNDLREQEQRLLQLAYNSVRKRVAEALVMLHARYETDPGARVTMAVSREDLAGIVGTAKESVIRVLSDFKDEGIVETRASEITILNLDKLKRMKN